MPRSPEFSPTLEQMGIKGQEMSPEGRREEAGEEPKKSTWFSPEEFDEIEAAVRRESGKEEEISPEELEKIEKELAEDRIFASSMVRDKRERTSGIVSKLAKTPLTRRVVLGMSALSIAACLAAGGCGPEKEKPKEEIVQVMTPEEEAAKKARKERFDRLLGDAHWKTKPSETLQCLRQAEEIARTKEEIASLRISYIRKGYPQDADRILEQLPEEEREEILREEKFQDLMTEAETASKWAKGQAWGEKKPEFPSTYYLREAEKFAGTSSENFEALGNQYVEQKSIRKAMELYRKAVEESEDYDQIIGIYRTLLDLTVHYQIDPDLQKECRKKVESMTREKESFEDLCEIAQKWESGQSSREAKKYLKKALKVLDREIKEARESKDASQLKDISERLQQWNRIIIERVLYEEENEEIHQLQLQLRDEIQDLERK